MSQGCPSIPYWLLVGTDLTDRVPADCTKSKAQVRQETSVALTPGSLRAQLSCPVLMDQMLSQTRGPCPPQLCLDGCSFFNLEFLQCFYSEYAGDAGHDNNKYNYGNYHFY